MLVRLIDAHNDTPLWVNAQQVRVVLPQTAETTTLGLVGGDTLTVVGPAAEVATQLQDALAGRKYVDFWSS